MKSHLTAFLRILFLLTVSCGFTQNGCGGPNRLGVGIGPFRLGMTPEQVNNLLPQPFGSITNMPVAAEFHASEIRYFWTYTAQFPSPNARGSVFESLSPLRECWGTPSSYVTFLFSENRLVRISVRFFGDCGARDQAAKAFADSYHIPAVRREGNIWFRKVLRNTTIELRLSRELTAVDVFESGSPQPPVNWPEKN